MPNRVPLSAIVQAIEMQGDDYTSYVHRPTGRVLMVSEAAIRAAEDDDEEAVEPEELADARSLLAAEQEYLPLPDRFEIDEYRMMERFALGIDDAAGRDAALRAIRGRGAFRYFKDTVYRLGLFKSWQAFRDNAYIDVAREWCETNDVEYDPREAEGERGPRVIDG